MHIPAEVTTLANVAAGAVIGWGSTSLTQRRTRRHARELLRRDAYAALILALDHLERAWDAPETLQDDVLLKNMGTVTGQAVREIQRAYVAVLLVGAKPAKSAADTARLAAWALNDRLRSLGGQADEPDRDLTPSLGTLLNELRGASRGFTQAAEHEGG